MRRSPLRSAGVAYCAWLALAVLSGCALTGCGAGRPAQSAAATSTAQSPAPAAAGRKCGSGRTAAGVPVVIEIGRGPVGCPAAIKIERAYAAALASGHAPGNGGGGPVSVRGWVCRGFDTPEILRSGNTSQCSRGPSEILAVLAMPSGSASPSQ
jgi:hypothetical protein